MSIPVLIVPVLNRYDLLDALLESIDHPVDQVIVVDNGGKWPGPSTQKSLFQNGHAIRMPHNLGVSAGWNLGLKASPLAPWWLISNSDLVFGPGDLARLEQAVDPTSNDHYFMLGMALFGITRHTLRDVGYFDENFHPAYDEDLDWHRRALLAGSKRVDPEFTGTHVGSATIRSDKGLWKQNGATHAANDAYYARKWGGPKQGGETYSTPFDRGGHVGDWRLEPERLATQSWKKE